MSEVLVYQGVKEVKADVLKAVKYLEDAEVAVKIYETNESDNGEDVYDVEIFCLEGGEYVESFTLETHPTLSSARKRANQIKTSVKGWFRGSDVEVAKVIEVYHA